jgi:hypothetical protein
MKPRRLEFGLTDIERNHKEAARRLRNCITALLIVALSAGLLNYLTQIGDF